MAYAQSAVVSYNTMRHAHGGIDTLYSFVLSEQGAIYDGASYEPDIAHASVCMAARILARVALFAALGG